MKIYDYVSLALISKITARTIRPIPNMKILLSSLKPHHPNPIRQNMNPMKSSKGRNLLGLISSKFISIQLWFISIRYIKLIAEPKEPKRFILVIHKG